MKTAKITSLHSTHQEYKGLDGPAIRNANRAIRANRFGRIDSQKNPYFHNVRAIRANRLKPAIRNF